jgi:predicted small lipoprotein YifL
MIKALVVTLAIAALAGCAEMGKKGPEVKGHLSACPANKTPIGDVPSCGKIWRLGHGEAELERDGELEVEVYGLVLNDASTGDANGTPDGVDGVAAAVVCGGKVVAQTDVVPLSKDGNAKIDRRVSVPSDCANLVIVLRERYEGKIGGWLAATGR